MQKQSQVKAFKIIWMDSAHRAKCITDFDAWLVWYSLSCFAASPLLAANILVIGSSWVSDDTTVSLKIHHIGRD